MTSSTKRKSVIKGSKAVDSSESVGLAKQNCLKTNISAHRSNKNSKDDNPETIEILQNPTTKYDAHNAEGNM